MRLKKNCKNCFKKYYINEEKRLCFNTKIRNQCNGAKKDIKAIIILIKEKYDLMDKLHKGLGHQDVIDYNIKFS